MPVGRHQHQEIAGQRRRHGYRMLHNRLRHEGWAVNVKRTWRFYCEEGLAVRKRRRKKLPVTKRQQLVRPEQPNEIWDDRTMNRPGAIQIGAGQTG